MEEVNDLVKNALLVDIHLAERSFELNRYISNNIAGINDQGFLPVARILYDLTYTEMILGLSRLFDSVSSRYETRSLKSLYRILHSRDYKVDLKESRSIVLSELCASGRHLGMLDYFLSIESDWEFNKVAIQYFETIEFNSPIIDGLQRVKTIRDKYLAHNENIAIDTELPYESISHLLDFAKDVVSFFSLAYGGVRTSVNGHFYLSDSSKKWVNQFATHIGKNSV